MKHLLRLGSRLLLAPWLALSACGSEGATTAGGSGGAGGAEEPPIVRPTDPADPLASKTQGPVVYARMSDAIQVWPVGGAP